MCACAKIFSTVYNHSMWLSFFEIYRFRHEASLICYFFCKFPCAHAQIYFRISVTSYFKSCFLYCIDSTSQISLNCELFTYINARMRKVCNRLFISIPTMKHHLFATFLQISMCACANIFQIYVTS